ncbi:hypothetical protein KAJ87_02390 [Candidatus Pacearchaeota archaeon]|nr:hypothetical protein [Candidatus Pacearchaeota archaeon]
MVNKFIKEIHSLLPINYRLWKENQDDVYYQIKKSLKFSWLSTQCTIHSSMNLSLFILLFTLGLGFILKSFELKSFFLYVFCSCILIFIILYLLLLNHHYDKYVDEKYLEFSKTNTKQ